ncbi:MAG TPA: hypothetical protein VEC57_18705 [Candidatus Limnocylindrales bacterium]|nr:hypothetical protein [Candidatus Limnocylindrales bacterium]
MQKTTIALIAAAFAASLCPAPVPAADHADTPNLIAVARHDGRLTDLHVFIVGDDLVLSLATNPNIPPSATSYTFASDTTFRIHIDRRPGVTFEFPENNTTFGGTLKKPHRLKPDITFKITFLAGSPEVEVEGKRIDESQLQVFAGLRDDPFIRGPRQGRNVGAIVLQLPLSAILGAGSSSNNVIAVWASSDVPTVNGSIEEHAGRALRSQFGENDVLNNLPPGMHASMLNMVPDVILFDTALPAVFPNGRRLEDDVVDLVGHGDTLATDAPFPSANDKAFLSEFPYLAEPW